MSTVIDFLKGLIAKEPTRLVAWTSAAAVAGALKLAEFAGVTLSAEIIAGISALAALVATELIRRFVYAPATVEKIADAAATTGVASVGPPPSGDVDDLPAPYAGDEEE